MLRLRPPLPRLLHGCRMTKSSAKKDLIIWTSNSSDPYLNLSLEEYLFRKVQINSPILFIYRNRKSVIIGRNQNPWQESDLNQLDRQNICMVRRRSGGGTVYHDEGNTNYSIMLPRDQFERKLNTAIVAKSVQQMGIDSVNVTNRYDVCIGDQKVSGSAFRITTKRAYHHGTMLIDSNLERLKGSLRPTPNITIVDSKAVGSVRSPVTCLVQNQTRLINHQQFAAHLSKNFVKVYYGDMDYVPDPNVMDDSELETNAFVRAGYEELKSWDWIFGQTPQFTRRVEIEIDYQGQREKIPIEVTYKKGKVDTARFVGSYPCHDGSHLGPAFTRVVEDHIHRLFPVGGLVKF